MRGSTPDGRRAIVEAFLLDRRLEAWPVPRTCLPVVDRWIERSANLSIDALRVELEISNRQMRRLTLAHHGLSPKALAMKYRARRCRSAGRRRFPTRVNPTRTSRA